MDIKGIYHGAASNALGNLVMLGATLWLTHVISPEEFGQFRVAANLGTLAIPFLALGGERAISRLLQSEEEPDRPVAAVLVAVGTLTLTGTILLAVAYPLLSGPILGGNVPPLVYILSIAIIPVTIAYNFANTIWRHRGDAAKAQVHLNLYQRLLRAPMLIGLSLAWPTAMAATIAMVSSQLLSLLHIRKHLTRYIGASVGPIGRVLRRNLPTLASIGVPVAVMASIDRLDVLIVNAVIGVDAAGVYDLVFMLSLTAMFPAMALAKTTEPHLYGVATDPDRQKRLRSLQKRAFILSVAGVVGIAVLGPLVGGFLGNADASFAPSALILAAGIAFSSVYGPVIEYLQINGRQRTVLVVFLILLPVFFALKYLAALGGSLVWVAGTAGLFYFTLRLVLSLIIWITDRVWMANIYLTLGAWLGYGCVIAYTVWSS